MVVISLYMDFTSSVYKAHIDSDGLYISAMSIHLRRLQVHIDVISISYRCFMVVTSLYMDFTSSVYKAHIDFVGLYFNVMSIHIRCLYVVYRCRIEFVSMLYGCHIVVYGFHIERI